MFFSLAVIYGCMQLVAAMLLANPTAVLIQAEAEVGTARERVGLLGPGSLQRDKEAQRQAALEAAAAADSAPSSSPPLLPSSPHPGAPAQEGLAPSAMVQTLLFWNMWGIFFLNFFAVVFISTQYKAFGQTFIHDDKLLSRIGAVAAIFNGLGRIGFGKLGDAAGFRTAITSLCLAMAVLLATFTSTAALGGAGASCSGGGDDGGSSSSSSAGPACPAGSATWFG